MEFVPEALAPDFACPAVEEWYAGGNQKEQDEESFLTGTCLAQPRGNHRDEQVESEKREHKPQMSCKGGEVQKNP